MRDYVEVGVPIAEGRVMPHNGGWLDDAISDFHHFEINLNLMSDSSGDDWFEPVGTLKLDTFVNPANELEYDVKLPADKIKVK